MLSQFWLLAIIPALAWFLAKLRTSRALSRAEVVIDGKQESVSEEQMGKMVRELTNTLQPPTKVTLPVFEEESSHVWTSSSGKRVYMN